MTERILDPVPLAEQDFWRKDAACFWAVSDNEELQNAWVEEDNDSAYFAELICATCPVREACLMDALVDQDAEGLRAGFFFATGGVNSADARKIRQEFGVRPRTRSRRTPGYTFVVPKVLE